MILTESMEVQETPTMTELEKLLDVIQRHRPTYDAFNDASSWAEQFEAYDALMDDIKQVIPSSHLTRAMHGDVRKAANEAGVTLRSLHYVPEEGQWVACCDTGEGENEHFNVEFYPDTAAFEIRA